MKTIISPISRELLLEELHRLSKIRDTRHGGNEIYLFDAASAPNLMREVGRLREESFRAGGGGTGEEIDIDVDDTAPEGYKQLIAWDPAEQEIVGGYRCIICPKPDSPHLSTSHYFHFSEQFRQQFLPQTIELGRAFVQPKYQASGDCRSIYALENLWDGIGALIALNPQAKYLLGKVTIYPTYHPEALKLLYYFLHRYFPDNLALVEGIDKVHIDTEKEKNDKIFTGETYLENYRLLRSSIHGYGEMIPPLMNSYMNLSNTMRVFDTVHNKELGDVYETGIMITIPDIFPEKYDRYTKF